MLALCTYVFTVPVVIMHTCAVRLQHYDHFASTYLHCQCLPATAHHLCHLMYVHTFCNVLSLLHRVNTSTLLSHVTFVHSTGLHKYLSMTVHVVSVSQYCLHLHVAAQHTLSVMQHLRAYITGTPCLLQFIIATNQCIHVSTLYVCLHCACCHHAHVRGAPTTL